MVHPLVLLDDVLFLLGQLALVVLYIDRLLLLLVGQRVTGYVASFVSSHADETKSFSDLTRDDLVLLRIRARPNLFLQMAKDIVGSLELIFHGLLGLIADFFFQFGELRVFLGDLRLEVLFSLFHFAELESEIAFARSILDPLVRQVLALETFARLRGVLGRLPRTRWAHRSLQLFARLHLLVAFQNLRALRSIGLLDRMLCTFGFSLEHYLGL